MVTLAMLLVTALVVAFLFFEHVGIISNTTNEWAGVEGFSIRSLAVFGLIPLSVATFAIAIFRPAKEELLGARPSVAQLLFAPLTGFLVGLLIWTSVELIQSLTSLFDRYLSIPELWDKASFYMKRSPVTGLLTLLVAVVVPATSQELLFRGVILPSFSIERRRIVRIVLPALLAAVLSADLEGLVVLFLMSLFATWVRVASQSIYASSLATVGMSLSMLFARPLFFGLSTLLFRMPLVDNLRIRLFHVTCALILVVLLIAPMSVIGARAGKRAVMPRKKQARHSLSHVNRIVAILCIATTLIFYYFFL